ncbi:MAG: type II toxin-antitoxin system RelE/ParE family toxin [Bryobacteraceae bacterium]
MSPTVNVNPKAVADIDDHAFYLGAEVDTELCLRFLDAADSSFALLATEPEMGWRPRIRHPRLKGVRMWRITGFEDMLVFYRPQPNGVDILRIVNGKRNLRKFLRQEGLE